MTRSSKRINFILLIIFLLSAMPIFGQDITADVDKIFGWTKPNEPGCVVAASQNGKQVVNKAYGRADIEREVALTTDSVLDVGSVRKQFVAAAVLMLVDEGKLSLSDDVRKHIPQMPDYAHEITIDHLLTHTSGIRDWQPLLNLAGGDPDAMTMILRQRELNFIPGDEWSYSNSGYVLLPDIVSRTSGVPFAEFLRKRLFEPLGMTKTIYVFDQEQIIMNRALAYKKEKDIWKMDMYLGNDRGGAGALFTTASDLVRWNEALAAKRLGEFVSQKLQEPATLNDGRKVSYSRGLNIELRDGRGGRLVWHSGGAAGYSALAGHLPQYKLAVAMTCNLDGGARSVYASRIFDKLLPPEPEPVETPAADVVAVTPADLKGRAGTFFNEKTGEPLRLGMNNNTLMVAGAGPLAPLAADRFRNLRPTLFFMSEAEFELKFLTADRIEIKVKGGPTMFYRRAKAYTPTADELRALAGSYRSDELSAVFDATPTKDGLDVRANERNTIEFKPVEKDTFQFGGSLLRFRRDGAGRVMGLEYSNPLLRKVKFVRVADR